jgi:hypothetical protein
VFFSRANSPSAASIADFSIIKKPKNPNALSSKTDNDIPQVDKEIVGAQAQKKTETPLAQKQSYFNKNKK